MPSWRAGGGTSWRHVGWSSTSRSNPRASATAGTSTGAPWADDLYDLGRATPLSRNRSGEVVTAGRHLEQTWGLARARLGGLVGAEELARVDAVVASADPLPRPQEGAAS